MYAEFWDIVLNPIFLVTVGIIALPFLALLWSVYDTWINDGEIKGEIKED